MLNLDAISNKIILKRKQMGLTQNELADALYVSRQAVSKWEMGKSLPSLEVFVEMTKIFDVTIDFMLDGTDLKTDDYAAMFMQYPRESVIYHFLNSSCINDDIKNIFYLLTQNERRQIIDQFFSGKINIQVHMLWPCLSLAEREYLLGNLISKDMDQNIDMLYNMMTLEEKMMTKSKRKEKNIHINKRKKGDH
jgi:transcriptional regulator with XRE-family HTH domain